MKREEIAFQVKNPSTLVNYLMPEYSKASALVRGA
jgi:hypothetical protein